MGRIINAYQATFGKAMPVDYFTASGYVMEKNGTDINVFKNQIVKFREFIANNGYQDKGLIIHEYGCAFKGPSPADITDFMNKSFTFLMTARDQSIGCIHDDYRLVQKWAWFTLHSIPPVLKLREMGLGAFYCNLSQSSLYTKNGQLNCLGREYAKFVGGTAQGSLY